MGDRQDQKVPRQLVQVQGWPYGVLLKSAVTYPDGAMLWRERPLNEDSSKGNRLKGSYSAITNYTTAIATASVIL